MKCVLVVLVGLVVVQTTYGQCFQRVAPSIINGCGCGVGGCGCGSCGCDVPICGPSYIASPAAIPATIVQSNSVASSLADTLSLLTVSSLLADTLPLACGCGYGGFGCGCGGCGYGGCGYGGCYF